MPTSPALPPDDLVARLTRLVGSTLATPETADRLPPDKGAYLLLARLDNPLPLTIKTLPPGPLAPGFYVYCGSARGPGGLRARLRRHFRTEKRLHWHIDHLTIAAGALWALAVTGGDECRLRQRIEADGNFIQPVGGFGAADCRQCDSHLLMWTGADHSP